VRKDGSRFDAELSTIRIDADGRAFEIIRDLTDRRRAEEAVREMERASALRASEAKFRVLIERSADMVVVLDDARRIRFWSPSATAALGRAEERVVGRSALELVHPDDEPELSRALGAVLSGPGSTSRVTARLAHEDGSYRLVEAHVRNLLHDPAVCGIVLNARDVTEQRRLEEQYRQAQKLESIGRLAGGVAHDFNNLLTVILGTAEVLKEDRASGALCDPEDLDQIRVAGERARDLTQQLLAFARKQVIAPAPLDLNAVVRGSEKLMRRVLGEDVELAVRADPALWPVVCDAAQIGQLLLNLAANARDSMPLGGRLGIETRNAVLRSLEAARPPGVPAGEWVRLSVRDSGAGMSPEAKAHLFEPFFTTKEQGRGTGLGLATVHGIVAQSGGHIRVESSPGEGTVFDIFFPRSREAPAVAPEPQRANTSSGTETVFVVEDDPMVREITVRSLRSNGYRVLPARSGREAFDIAARERDPVHLLVTDVVMPELDGRMVADRLRRQYPDLRVLFVSGYTHDVIGRHGVLDAGGRVPAEAVHGGVVAGARAGAARRVSELPRVGGGGLPDHPP
jgi:two-component system, cell cycle sensor histidine kinase and response regulator CckA